MAAETTASGPAQTSPGRAVCEAFWAAAGAGPGDSPAAAWDWASAQNTRRAWEAAAKAAIDARLTAAEHERDEARAERDKLRDACRHLGHLVTGMARTFKAARIEMIQSGPGKAMEWVLSSIPDVDDDDPADQWDGTESAGEWFGRAREAAK